jgi:LL-diaminopimelate aminotransferase
MKREKMFAQRLEQLPPYLFVEIDRRKRELKEKGKDLIDFGIGDPDQPTPLFIREEMKKAIENPLYHHYPLGGGLAIFRQEIANWYKRRFQVDLNPEKEILSLIGSKEGIGHLPLAFVNPGDYVLVPCPAYPVYRSATILAGGKPYFLPLKEENGFLPDLDEIPPEILEKAKLLFLNYPNNPTTALADKSFFEKVIDFAREHKIIVAHDAAYSEIYFSSPESNLIPPISFLSLEGAKEVGIEFHSLSKTYNMTGWRIGWVCGNEKIIKGLAKVKDNYDSGLFEAIQIAGVKALKEGADTQKEICQLYQRRRDLFTQGLRKLGWEFKLPLATFYLWVKVPSGYSSTSCAEKLLEEGGIVVTPGNGLGKFGEGYLRFALVVEEERIEEALLRLEKIRW